MQNQLPKKQDYNLQLTLFSHGDAFSNALMFLHTVPRFDRRKENHALQREVDSPVRIYNTLYDNKEYQIRVTGAPVARHNAKTGKIENFIVWPSNREERVEAAILKVATSGGITSIDTDSARGYGCYFSIYQIRDLTGMNATDIKEAIDIMNKSNLEIKSMGDNSESWSATFLPVRYVSSKIGSKDDKCWVIFHPAVMSAINNLRYRPYLYEIADSHKKGLTKYLHKRLIIMFTYANENNSYNISLRRLMNDFGKVPLNEEITEQMLRNISRDARISLLELADAGVILPNFEMKKITDDMGNVIDRNIVVKATSAFIKQQKHSNFLVKEMQQSSSAQSENEARP